jgi:hypothetical protein
MTLITGSNIQYGTIYDLKIDIVSMTKNINDIVNQWAMKYNGISFISSEDEDNIQIG